MNSFVVCTESREETPYDRWVATCSTRPDGADRNVVGTGSGVSELEAATEALRAAHHLKVTREGGC